MTDKQIIIDGKECRYWFRLNPDDYRKCSLRGKNDNCDEINDCFIKELLGKLARKEQELQEAMDNYVQLDLQRVKEYNELVELYKAKEQECEKLKETLTEIKEIAEKTKKDICNNCGWRNTDSCDPEDYTCGEFIKILQKISECEVENA